MRWNRGTIVLIAALLVVIVAVLVINNNQASAPGETPTPSTSTGALLPVTDGSTITRYEVRDNSTGDFAALTKDSGGAWHIDATNALPTRDPDQSLIDTTAGKIVSLNYSNSFTNDQLSTFGLDAPTYSLLVTTADGSLYTIYIGNKAPTSPSYYTIVQTGTAAASTAEAPAATVEATAELSAAATAEATAESTAEPTPNRVANPGVALSGSQTVYVIPQTVIDTLTKWLQTPPYAPLPTEVPTEIALPTVVPTAEATAELTPEMTVEPTAEATVAP